MTIKELRNWMFSNSLEDQWWISIDGVTKNETISLSDVSNITKQKGTGAHIQVLHASQAGIETPPWTEIEPETSPSASPSTSPSASLPPLQNPAVVKKGPSTTYIVFGYVFALLFPLAGFIIGLVLIARKAPHHGAPVLILSIIFWFIYFTMFSGAS